LARFIYIAPQAAYVTVMVLLSQTQPAYNLGCSHSPQSRILACSHTAVRSPSLPFQWFLPP